jgi:two-component system nitrate/nitrite response regulator NarL
MVRSNSLEPGFTKVRVLVADSTRFTGHLIVDALKKDRGLSVTSAEAGAVPLTAANLKADVAIISEQLQGKPGGGFEVLTELRGASPSTRAVMLLDSAERGLVVEAFRKGARGVFSRSDPLKMLTRCIRKVHDGQLWIGGTQLEFVLEALAQAPAAHLLVDVGGTNLLSKREQDVVRWLPECNTNRKIARKLNISENTVKNHLFHVFAKLGVSNRVEVVIYSASQKTGVQSVKPGPCIVPPDLLPRN